MKKAIVSLLVGLMTIGGVNSVVKAETLSKNEVENKVEIIAVKDNTQKEDLGRIVISCIYALGFCLFLRCQALYGAG